MTQEPPIQAAIAGKFIAVHSDSKGFWARFRPDENPMDELSIPIDSRLFQSMKLNEAVKIMVSKVI